MSGKGGLVRQFESVHLLFEQSLSDTRTLSAKLMETFDVGRMVFMKKSPKDKTLFRSVIIVMASQKNAKLLMNEFIALDNKYLKVVHLTLTEADDLIDQKRTKLYVGNIPFPADNQMLWNYFAQFGKIDYTYILKRPVQRGPKGFGFVIFQGRDSVERALANRNCLFGVKLNCKMFSNKANKANSTTSGDIKTDTEFRHDEDDHCKNCCEECSEDGEHEEEHTEKCMDDQVIVQPSTNTVSSPWQQSTDSKTGKNNRKPLSQNSKKFSLGSQQASEMFHVADAVTQKLSSVQITNHDHFDTVLKPYFSNLMEESLDEDH